MNLKTLIAAPILAAIAMAGLTVATSSPASAQTCEPTCRGDILSPADAAHVQWGPVNIVVDYAGEASGRYYLSYERPGVKSFGAFRTDYTAGQAKTQFTYNITDNPVTGNWTVKIGYCPLGYGNSFTECPNAGLDNGASVVRFTVDAPTNTLGCSFVNPAQSSKHYDLTIGPELVMDCTGVEPGQYRVSAYSGSATYNKTFNVYADTTTVSLPAPTFTKEGYNQMNSRPATAAIQTGGYRQRFTSFQVFAGPHPEEGHYETRYTTTTKPGYYKSVTKTVKKMGDAGTRSRRGCKTPTSYWQARDVFLDCWGGKFAKSVYAFSIPSGAINVSKSVSGSVYCCKRGTLTRAWTHPTATKYVFTAKVTGWRAYQVRSVSMSYTIKTWVPPVTTTTSSQVWVCDAYCN